MIYRKAKKEDINDLVEMRMAYLLEEQGHIKEADRIKIEKSLPAYFTKHLTMIYLLL